MMQIEQLIADKPNLHIWEDGSPASWAASPKVLEFIHHHLQPEMTTLETGSGHTTVVFAMAGTTHFCITPSDDEPQKILQYCAQVGIQPNITFLNQSSDEVLPNATLIPASLDFVFIDGAHRFPFPCIDFHYTESKLKVGGILGVDDVDMPSVKILYNFLRGETEWELMEKIGNTAFFKRIKTTQHLADWQGQNINKSYKTSKGLISGLKRTAKKALPFLGK